MSDNCAFSTCKIDSRRSDGTVNNIVDPALNGHRLDYVDIIFPL